MFNLTFKQQLTLAFAALVAAVVVVGFAALYFLGQANSRFDGFVNGMHERENLASDIRALANQRAVGVRDMVLTQTDADRVSSKAMAVGAHEELTRTIQLLKASVGKVKDSQERALVARIAEVESRYAVVALKIVALADAKARDAAIELMNKDCRPVLAELLASTKEYADFAQHASKESVLASAGAYAFQRNVMIAVASAAALMACVLGWLIVARLMNALGTEPAELSETASRVAQGDLRSVAGAARAPAGSVLSSMGAMQQQLVSLIGQVRSSAEGIATASAEIAQGNSDLSGRTEEQASALQQTAASMDQLNSTVKQNADNARQANQLAQGASEIATRGGQVVEQVVDTMRGISDSSKKIADIIGVIDSIAFQTNILALNAAVEAARAGEQGRGFAVVAAEVRTLAGRSAAAAKEIKTMISVSAERVDQGALLVDQAGTTMSEVVGGIRRVADIMGEISSASVEQSAGVLQVGQAVAQMDRSTQQNAALVEQSAAAAESLKMQAQRLVEAVSVFRVETEAQA